MINALVRDPYNFTSYLLTLLDPQSRTPVREHCLLQISEFSEQTKNRIKQLGRKIRIHLLQLVPVGPVHYAQNLSGIHRLSFAFDTRILL